MMDSSAQSSTAPSSGTKQRTVRSSSRKGLADSALGTRNLMILAALAVVSQIVLLPLNYLAPTAGAAPGAVYVACSILFLWVIPFLLPATVVRRPGAVLVASFIMGVIGVFTTPVGPAALPGNLLGGAFIEVPLALMLYRKWTWWSYLVAAAVFGLFNSAMYVGLLKTAVGVPASSAMIVIGVASAVVGGGVAILLTRLLNRAGVGIDHRG